MPIIINQRGIIEFVGEHDTGKTIASLDTVYPYDNTVFVDDDVKGSATVEQMKRRKIKIGKYINMGQRRAKLGSKPTPKQLLEEIIEPIVDEICSKRWEVIIWDTWRTVYQAHRMYIERNQNEFRDVVKWQGSSNIIQGLVSRVARLGEQVILNRLQEAAELVVITHHIKAHYKENVEVGVIPESSATFSEVCSMRVWLRRNPESSVPIMLFLKRPNAPVLIKGRMRFVDIVPPKITPRREDGSIWDAIARYEQDPVQGRELRPDEQPTKEEMQLIKGTLSEDQRNYIMEILKRQKLEQSAIIAAATSTQITDSVPVSGMELISMAMKVYDIDIDTITKITGIDTDTLIEMEGNEVRNAWNKIQEEADGAGIDRIEATEAEREKEGKKSSSSGSNGRTANKSRNRRNKNKR